MGFRIGVKGLGGRALALGLLLPAALALAACDSVTAVQSDGTFPLQVGDRADVNGSDFSVRFVSVTQDSRCPRDVVCVTAGDAVVRLRMTSHGTTVETDLHTNSTMGPVSDELDGHVVELLELTPAPISTVQIQQRDYTARLRISHL